MASNNHFGAVKFLKSEAAPFSNARQNQPIPQKLFFRLSPLSERITKETKILSLSELFGGTKAFSPEAFDGAVALISEAAKNGKPYDCIIINGGLLPEIGAYASKSNWMKMDFMVDGVESLPDAAHLIRRKVKLLIEAAGSTPIIYVFGEEDDENVKSIMTRMVDDSNAAESIKAKIQKLDEDVKSIETRLKSMGVEISVLNEELESLLKKKSSRPSGAKAFGKADKKIKDITKKIGEIEKKAIELRNRKLEKQNYISALQSELSNLMAVQRTNTHTLLPSEVKKIKEEALLEYNSRIARVFEGAQSFYIISSNFGFFDINGVRIGIAHKAENTSRTAKPQQFSFVENSVFRMTFAGQMPEVDAFFYTHHPGTKVWALPSEYTSDHPRFIIQTGTMASPKGIFEAWNNKIKIPQTEALHRYQFDSGILEVQFRKDGSATFAHIGYGKLLDLARPGRELEKKKLSARLGRGGYGRILSLKKSNGEAGENRLLENAKLLLEPPSRLTDEDLAKLSNPEEKKSEFVKRLVFVPKKSIYSEIRAALISDTHLGGGNYPTDHTSKEILNACIADIRKRGLPNVLVLAGDMVDAALGLVANELQSRVVLDYQVFKKLLQNEVDAKRATLEEASAASEEFFYRVLNALTMPNVSVQKKELEPLAMLAVDVVNNKGQNGKPGDVIFISGNHFNKTHKENRFDESIEISQRVIDIGHFGENHPNLHTFMGGKRGSGHITVQGLPLFGQHGSKSNITRDVVTGGIRLRDFQRRTAAVNLTGHWHDPVWAMTLGSAVISIPSTAPLKAHLDEIGAHGGLRGYTDALFVVNRGNLMLEEMHIEQRLYPQLLPYLPKINPLFIRIFEMMVKKDRKS